MISAAIVGLGRWGRTLVHSVQEGGRPKGDRIAIKRGVVRNLDKAADYGKAQAIELTTDYDDVLADRGIDAVILATPHSLHVSQVARAAAAGKHVFVEKPLALNATDAAAIAQTCAKARIVLAVGQNRRFLPLVIDLKRMIEASELGTILHAEGNFSMEHGLIYPPDDWRANDLESPGGALTASGIHIIDSFIYLLGTVTQSRALSRRRVLDLPLDDTTVCLVEFESGATGYLGAMQATARFFSVHIFGTKGWAHMLSNEELEICLTGETPQTHTYPATDIERAELEAFAETIENATPYPVPVDQVVHGIAVQDAIVASCAQDGAPIAVREAETAS